MLDYTRAIGVDHCAFHGVRRDGQIEWGCGRLWDKYKREQLVDAIARATEKIERYLEFPVSKKYFVEQLDYNYRNGLTVATKWKKVIEIGVQTTEDISLAVAPSYGIPPISIDPIVLTIPTTVTSANEIHVFHTENNGEEEIETTKITISGGVATIKIPRCHLVIPDSYQPEDGYDYDDPTVFVDEVDVKRVYTDLTDGVDLIYTPCGYCSCCSDGTTPCVNTEQEACGVLRDPERGQILVRPATYNSGWSSAAFLANRRPYAARVSYAAGCLEDIPSLESAIFRLAHTEMPQAICSCTIHEETWRQDREEPKSLAWDTLQNPFGTLRGQIYAWNTVSLFALGQGGLF